MKIYIDKLCKSKNWDYCQSVEKYVGEYVANKLSIFFHDQTVGYAPQYDFMIGNHKIELKITPSSYPLIEFCRYNKQHSGLLLSTSDYYLIVSTGGSKGKFVGKIRLFKTKDLKKLMIENLKNKNIVRYKPDQLGPGAIGYKLNPHQIKNIWIGDCDLIYKDKKVVGFNL